MPAKTLERNISTHQRILEAAMARFAQFYYDEVKLQDIAQDAGVGFDHVHRSFGSKEQLFTEALNAAAPSTRRLWDVETGDIARAFTDHMLDHETILVRMFACSLSSPRARLVLREAGMTDFIEPLAAKLPEPALERAALLAACAAGIAIFRDVLRLEPLVSLSRDRSRALMEGIFEACLTEKQEGCRVQPRKPVALAS